MELNGVTFSRRTSAEIDHLLWEGNAQVQQPYWVVTANAEMFYYAARNPSFAALLNQAQEVVIDGSGPVFAIRALYHVVPDRISGSSIVHRLSEHLKRSPQVRVHVILTPEGLTNKEQLLHWTQRHGLEGRISASYPTETTEEMVRTKIVFVTLGSPAQEQWIHQWIKQYGTPAVYVGIGGAIDTLVGTVHPAPRIFSTTGLEWLWRLMIQPKRLPRIFRAVILFPWSVLQGRLKTHST